MTPTEIDQIIRAVSESMRVEHDRAFAEAERAAKYHVRVELERIMAGEARLLIREAVTKALRVSVDVHVVDTTSST